MGVVFRARDIRHDRIVAIKVVRPDVAASLGAERLPRWWSSLCSDGFGPEKGYSRIRSSWRSNYNRASACTLALAG